MQTGHTLTTLARLEARTQAWRSADELTAYLGVPCARVRRAAQVGLIAHLRSIDMWSPDTHIGVRTLPEHATRR